MPKQKTSTNSKVAISIGIIMIIVSPLIFFALAAIAAASSDAFISGTIGIFYGFLGASVWLLASFAVITYGILKNSNGKKSSKFFH